MAPKTTKALAAYLRELILQHHTAFKELYPERPITPKMHYIIHIPQWIIRLGDMHIIATTSPHANPIHNVCKACKPFNVDLIDMPHPY